MHCFHICSMCITETNPFLSMLFFLSFINQGLESEVQQDPEMEGAPSLFAAAPQSTPKKTHPTQPEPLATFLLTSPEQTGPRTKPSRSGKYLALAPSWTMQSVGQLIYSYFMVLHFSCADCARLKILFFICRGTLHPCPP